MAGKNRSYTTDEVYGITREVPLNYVTRPNIDDMLVESLTRDRHLVIFGSSKQGKTCLRKHCLKDTDYILVQCSNKWQITELHTSILKTAGYNVVQSEKRTASGANKVNAEIKASMFGFGTKVGGESQTSKSSEYEIRSLELDAADPNDIISALQSIDFSKFIVLEDFHYLPIQTQIDFAVALKAFHEASKLTFILIGVWLEEDRLIVYNGDLTGRIVSIDADKWSSGELKEVIESGAKLLNVTFDQVFVDKLIPTCQGSVYVLQEACRLACTRSNVKHTQDETRILGEGMAVAELVEEIVNQQRGRYNSFINLFSGGFQDTTLKMYKWLLHPILTSNAEKLGKGFKFAELRKYLQSKHPSGKALSPGNLAQALKYCASLQVEKGIKPIVLDYDQTNLQLNIVDRGFIMWLGYQDRTELLNSLGIGDTGEAELEFALD
jgi:hypothetical protein